MNMPCNHNIEVEQFLARQEAEENMAEEREAMIEERAKDYMTEGERCDPYGIEILKGVNHVYYNLFSALSEIPESEQKVISEMWRDASERTDMFMVKREAVFARLDKLVKAYWAKCAKHQAESEHE